VAPNASSGANTKNSTTGQIPDSGTRPPNKVPPPSPGRDAATGSKQTPGTVGSGIVSSPPQQPPGPVYSVNNVGGNIAVSPGNKKVLPSPRRDNNDQVCVSD
jgi:hypothetical protein